MSQSKSAKTYATFGILFGVLAIFFAIVYCFNIIKDYSLLMAGTYVIYFVGLSLIYNGSYCKEKSYNFSKKLNWFFGIIFVLVAIALLVYGLTTGEITMFG